jgi:hypothetical protein
VIIDVTLEAFLCRDVTQLLAVSLQTHSSAPPNLGHSHCLEDHFCRKCKAEVKALPEVQDINNVTLGALRDHLTGQQLRTQEKNDISCNFWRKRYG